MSTRSKQSMNNENRAFLSFNDGSSTNAMVYGVSITEYINNTNKIKLQINKNFPNGKNIGT